MICKSLSELIGKTNILEIAPEVHKLKNVKLYAKLELFNPFGSIKDRTALALIKSRLSKRDQPAYSDQKQSKPVILEVTSGNTGKALQALAIEQKTKVRVLAKEYKIPEQRDLIMLLGGEIEEYQTSKEFFDGNDPNNPQNIVNQLEKSEPSNYVASQQFTSDANWKIHYETTAQEILDDLGKVDYFFGCLGTTGSSLGIIQKLREVNPDLCAVGVIDAPNNHVPGMNTAKELEIIKLFNKKSYQKLVEITEDEAIDNTVELIRSHALMCGLSTGASFAAVKKTLSNSGEPDERKALFIACDRVEPYLSFIKQQRPELFKAHKTIKVD
ncbi:MAG TPA: pyridoxal-phosphate dependent enzyme [Oligoflexia bacterium]|nr:pyridoxal-phosphate dependent enzyme [Oligoflexia bacterium]HMP27140.1 pyridoxal-phosphate dependent enzyme [Oligoflexia bacterium]